MTKEKMASLAKKYNMTLNRHPVTAQAVSYTVDSKSLIPELDAFADKAEKGGAVVTRTALDVYSYRIEIPFGWVKLGEV